MYNNSSLKWIGTQAMLLHVLIPFHKRVYSYEIQVSVRCAQCEESINTIMPRTIFL